MCGIAGIIGNKNITNNKVILNKMNNAMLHRGPDDYGIWDNGTFGLAHRRLSIIDLSPAGHQPMQIDNEDYVIVFNGEIYNYQEIKNTLGDINYKSNSDTEVILHAYKKYGKECVKFLNGMFAFALYDKKAQSLFIARDRLGKKPLYYSLQNNVFVFASEIRALLQSGLVNPKLDMDALSDYFRYQTVHSPNTIIKDVKMLKAGSYLTLNADKKITETCYWDITKINPAEMSRDEAKAKIKDLFFDSVSKRLISDVPFGAFLSGGIDSSAIVAVMSQVSSQKVNTFSVTFDEKQFSEAEYASLVAKKYNTNHHQINLTLNDFLDKLPSSLMAVDHPGGDGANTWMVSMATKKAGITVALTGLGGDELFAGYDVFKRSMSLKSKKWFNTIPGVFKNALGFTIEELSNTTTKRKLSWLLQLPDWEINSTYPLSRLMWSDKELSRLLSNPIKPNKVSEFSNSLSNLSDKHLLSKVSLLEINTYMQNVLLRDSDFMSMAHSLELRVPFLDYRLVELALSINDTTKYPNTPKQLFTEALGDLIPAEVINRPKMGFVFPWEQWMKKDMYQFCDSMIKNLSKRSFINETQLINTWNLFIKGNNTYRWSHFWYLIVLEHWLTTHGITE